MQIDNHAALVTGGGSGLGEATARELARRGAKVAVLDINLANAERVAAEINAEFGDARALACHCDITNTDSVAAALDKAAAAHGPARILMNIAGIGTAKRIVGKDGNAAPLEDFAKVINVNLIGSYNISRLFAAACVKLHPLEDGERGVMMFTASVAAFDGQVGQQAYSASKAGLAGMTLPMARDLAQHGIRVCTVAPGLFATPLMQVPWTFDLQINLLAFLISGVIGVVVRFPSWLLLAARLARPNGLGRTGGVRRRGRTVAGR